MIQPRFLPMVFSLLLVFPLVGAALAQPGTTPANPPRSLRSRPRHPL